MHRKTSSTEFPQTLAVLAAHGNCPDRDRCMVDPGDPLAHHRVMVRSLTLNVGSYNVHKGVGLDRRRDPHRILSVIREMDVDLLALQEVDRRFGDRRGVLDLDALAEETGLTPVPLAARKGELAHGWHGNLLLTRAAEVVDVRTLDLPGFEPRGAILADLRFDGQPLRVIGAHLGLLKGSRLAQARHLLDEIDTTMPTLLMGDLNEWRRGPGCSLTPFRLHEGASMPMAASFPANRPFLALDRIIGAGRAEVLDFASHVSPLARLASDHLPVRARVRLKP